MLNPTVFVEGMKLLELHPRFGKVLEKSVKAQYFELLSVLPDAQFQKAISLCFDGNTYFPTPAEIREKVLPSIEEMALEEWSSYLRAIATRTSANLSPAAQDAIAAIGGSSVVGSAEGRQLDYLRIQFLKFYGKHHKHAIASTPSVLPPAKSSLSVVGSQPRALPEVKDAPA